MQNYTTEYVGSSLEFSSPYRKSWFMIFGLSVSLVGVCVFLLASILQVFLPEMMNGLFVFPFPFLAVFLPFGVIILIEFLWQLFGVEITEVTESQITLKHYIFGLGISKNLSAQKIDGVFVSNQSNDWLTYMSRDLKFINFKKGAVAINYGKTLFGGTRTYRFGSILEREDAKQIVGLIHERFPQYQYRRKRKAG